MKRYFLGSSWISRKTHVSWLVAVASIGILMGTALAPHTDSTYVSSAWLIIAGSMGLSALISRRRYVLLVMLGAGMIVGLYRGSGQYELLADYQPLYGQQVIIQGRITEDASFGPKGDQRLRIGDVRIADTEYSGVLWVSTLRAGDIKRGDTVRLEGTLQKGFGNIPASMFRAKVADIQRPVPGDVGRVTRDWFAGGVQRALPAAEADLALAFLVGQKLTLSDTLNEQLRTVGLIHAVVASGYHLTILVSAARRLFVKTSKYLTALASGSLIAGFILITGFSPSMTRAGLVSGLSLLAWYYGRVIHPLVLLPFAAALTALYQPAYVWGDVGWYLSFAAFSGVILVAPLLHDYFWGKQKRPGLVREVVVATIAAQLTTLPIAIYVFGYYSAYALLANVLVVPLIPVTMLLTFVAGVIGLVMPAAALLAGEPVSLLLSYMIYVVEWLASIPGVKTELTFGVGAVVLCYLVIAAVIFWLWRVTGHNFRRDTLTQREF